MRRAFAVVFAFTCVGGCDAVFDLERVPGDAMVTGSCPAVFVGQRYQFFDIALSWPDAEVACRELDDDPDDSWHSHLAVLGFNEIPMLGLAPTEERWVGYTDRANPSGPPPNPNSFQWVTDEPNTDASWKAGQPNSSSSPPYCAWADGTDMTLHDSACDSSKRAYVCECDLYAVDLTNIYP